MKVRHFGDAPDVETVIRLTDGRQWRVPEETPVSFIYNGRNHAVMLATPADLVDFAVGFTITERIVDAPSQIEAIDIHQENRGVELRISIAPQMAERLDLKKQRRNLAGRSGCGTCGLEDAENFFETLPRVAAAPAIDEGALGAAVRRLPDFQPLNRRTRTVHAAAWSDHTGMIRFAREDVGRHNALDKLIGAMITDASDRAGFVVISSRCSYEMIEKCARAGIPSILSISAPTAFAIRKAREAAIRLYVRSGEGFFEVGS